MSAEILEKIQIIRRRMEEIIAVVPKKEHAFAAQLTSLLQSILFASPETIPGFVAQADSLIETSLPRDVEAYKPWHTAVYKRWSSKDK